MAREQSRPSDSERPTAVRMNISRINFLTRRRGPRPKLFISYRRRFDYVSARLLRQELADAFGDEAVFRDVENIAPGDPFPERIDRAIKSSDLFLVLISPGWVETVESLRDPDDFVRREIAAALARPVRVIPVLIGGARMPEAEELPADIRGLASRQAVELSDSRWDYDTRLLIEAIRASAEEPASLAERLPPPLPHPLVRRRGRLTLAALLLASLAAGATYFLLNRGPRDFDDCVRKHFPGVPQERFVTTEVGNYDTPLARADQPKEGEFVVRLNEDGRPVGALGIRFFPGDELFKVGGVVEPPCRVVEEYLNDDRKGADKHVLQNWDSLRVRLGGRRRILPPRPQGGANLAQFWRGDAP